MADQPRWRRGARFGGKVDFAADITQAASSDFQLVTGTGAPSGSEGLTSNRGIYLRQDASSVDAAVYVTVDGGVIWDAVEPSGILGLFTSANQIAVSDGSGSAVALDVGTNTVVGRTSGSVDDLAMASAATGDAVVVRDSNARAKFAEAAASGDALVFEQAQQQLAGAVAVAELVQSGQPVAGETVTIGADVYEFDGAGSNINVAIGASAEATLDNLVTAVNGSGTENVRADKSGTTTLVLRSAASPGGTVAVGNPSIALSEAATNYAWNPGNVNLNTLAGEAQALKKHAIAVLPVTAALAALSTFRVCAFDFTPTRFLVGVMDSTGAPKVVHDTFAVDATTASIVWTSAGTIHLVAGDMVLVEAWE